MCNRLESETLGSQPTMPKILPDHCWCGLWLHILCQPCNVMYKINRWTLCWLDTCLLLQLSNPPFMPGKVPLIPSVTRGNGGYLMPICWHSTLICIFVTTVTKFRKRFSTLIAIWIDKGSLEFLWSDSPKVICMGWRVNLFAKATQL